MSSSSSACTTMSVLSEWSVQGHVNCFSQWQSVSLGVEVSAPSSARTFLIASAVSFSPAVVEEVTIFIPYYRGSLMWTEKLTVVISSYSFWFHLDCLRGLWTQTRLTAHYTGASWHSSRAASHCADTVQDCCFDLRLCPRYWSCLPQASHLPSLELVTSVTPFGWPRRLVCFAGKHVHRPAKFHRRGSSRLERTSTWTTLTAQQSPTVPTQAESPYFPTSL